MLMLPRPSLVQIVAMRCCHIFCLVWVLTIFGLILFGWWFPGMPDSECVAKCVKLQRAECVDVTDGSELEFDCFQQPIADKTRLRCRRVGEKGLDFRCAISLDFETKLVATSTPCSINGTASPCLWDPEQQVLTNSTGCFCPDRQDAYHGTAFMLSLATAAYLWVAYGTM
jgi:hypothetical protein